MPKLTDPDSLTRYVNITFNTGSNSSGSKTIQLFLSGTLSNDGVTGQCVYSKCKELWQSQADLVVFPFPIISITEKKFDLVNSWDWHDALTRNLIRDAGWSLKNASNVTLQDWMGFITLGDVATGQVYYQQGSITGSAQNNTFTSSVNNAVQIYGAAGYGGFNYYSYFKAFIREQGRTYDQTQLSAIGETSVTYQTYAFPLQDTSDVKITHADVIVSSSVPYNSITMSYYTASQYRTIGALPYAFNTIINGAGATKEQIYEKVQFLLRSGSNINSQSGSSAAFSGSIIGKTADELLNFVGDTLYTSRGVYIDNISNNDINFYVFSDTGSNERTFPYVAAGTITFSDTLASDVSGSYKMFFTALPTGSYGSSSAVIVLDNNDNPITGSTSGSTSVSFTFDYDGNIQGNRTSGSDAPVTVVAIGLSTAQYVSTTATITRTNANAISLVSALERNYSNP